MSSSGMLLLLSALLLHSARAGCLGKNTSCPSDSCLKCSCGQTDGAAQICANDSMKVKLHDFVCWNLSVNSTCVCVNASFTVSNSNCTVPGHDSKDLLEKVWMILKQPQVIAAFLTGLLLSAFVCFLGGKCHRKKTAKNSFGKGESGAAGHSAVEPREVEYSDIDFSRWNRNNPAGAEHAQEATETEYAELQNDGNRQEPEEDSGDSEEDVAVAIGEEETEQ